MWILIEGSLGTGKQRVAEMIVRQKGFTLVDAAYRTHTDPLVDNLSLMLSRFKSQKNVIMPNQFSKNLVQVRSFWSVCEVFAKAQRDFELLKPSDFDILFETYEALKSQVTAPSLVLYLKAEKHIDQLNRVSLKSGEAYHESYLKLVDQYYEEYIGKIKASVVEINASSPFDQLWEEVDFGISSIKSSSLDIETIWERRYL